MRTIRASVGRPRLRGVQEFLVAAHPVATGALVEAVSLHVGVRGAVAELGEVLVAADGAAPVVAGEHGQVRVVRYPCPQPVVKLLGEHNVLFVVLAHLVPCGVVTSHALDPQFVSGVGGFLAEPELLGYVVELA